MNKGFLSILGLILLMIVSAITSYTQFKFMTIRRLDGVQVNELAYVLKTVQKYYQENCDDPDNDELKEYKFDTKQYFYILSDDSLYRDEHLYIQFTLDDLGCEYIDYSQH